MPLIPVMMYLLRKLFLDMENRQKKAGEVATIVPDSKTVDMGDSKISLKNDVQMTGQNKTFLFILHRYFYRKNERIYRIWKCDSRMELRL